MDHKENISIMGGNNIIDNNTYKSTYIVYLHPARNSELYNKLLSLWNKMKSTKIKNQAIIYPFHATLTSFFQDDVETVIKTCHAIFESDITVNKIIPYAVQDRNNSKNNIIGLSLNASKISQKMDLLLAKCKQLKSPSKNNLHITLAHMFEEKNREKIEKMMNDHEIFDSKLLSDHNKWCIAVWERRVYNNGISGWLQLAEINCK